MPGQKKDSSNSWHKDSDNPFSSTDIDDLILKAETKPAAVKSIFRAANILTCLSQGIYTITEISDVCKLNKTTVHRILKALVESHLAIQDPMKRRYYPGHSLSRIAASPHVTHEYLITCAFEPMRRLSELTRETVFINILLGLQYVNLHEIASTHELRVAEVTRKMGYVPAGSASKVLLSQLNNKELDIAVSNMDLKYPNGKVATREELIAELQDIRQKGYGVTCGERIEGCICISAPVTDYVLPVALNIIGPEGRIRPEMERYIRQVTDAARTVSDNVRKSFNT